MSQSRRTFIQSVTFAAVGGAVLPVFSQSGGNSTFDPENLILVDGASQELFEPYIGDRFSVLSGSKPMGTMTLIAVTGITPPKQANGQPVARAMTGFTLRFRGYGTPLPQDTYTLKNGALGSISIFLVPSGLKTSPTTYSAIFGQLPE